MEERAGSSNFTLSNAIYSWLETYKKHTVKAATYDRLIASAKMMEKYSIGWMNVLSIRSNDIQAYLNKLSEEGYSQSTIKKQLTLITAYMKLAYSHGIITTPYYASVNLPNGKKTKKFDTYGILEQKRLRKVLEKMDDPLYVAALIMLETGLRVGEVLSLTWNDILWNRRAINVDKTLVKLSEDNGKTFVQNSAKTETSNRIVPVSIYLMRILEEFVLNSDSTDGYIFHDEKGEPSSYAAIKYHLKKACAEANVEYHGCHIFRHTFATNCYNRGCDVKILSKLLGHADVSITYNTYIHLFGDALEEMRKVIE